MATMAGRERSLMRCHSARHKYSVKLCSANLFVDSFVGRLVCSSLFLINKTTGSELDVFVFVVIVILFESLECRRQPGETPQNTITIKAGLFENVTSQWERCRKHFRYSNHREHLQETTTTTTTTTKTTSKNKE